MLDLFFIIQFSKNGKSGGLKEERRRRASGGSTNEEVLSAIWWKLKNYPNGTPKKGTDSHVCKAEARRSALGSGSAVRPRTNASIILCYIILYYNIYI